MKKFNTRDGMAVALLEKNIPTILISKENSKIVKARAKKIHAAEAWINLANGNNAKALSLMKLAAQMESETSKHPVTPGEVVPAIELLGDMLLTLRKPLEAIEAYEINLKGHPGRFNGVYGAAIAAKKSGNNEKATYYFNQLLELAKNSKSDRVELVEAKIYINESKGI